MEDKELTHFDLLYENYLWGGKLRYEMPDGENVSINNLSAVLSRFAMDVVGNRFGAYMVLPDKFGVALKRSLNARGMNTHDLPLSRYGGIMGVFPDTTIYIGGTETVKVRTDHNELCWEFDVGYEHYLLDRPAILELVGPNKGFDMEVVYMPRWDSYAPLPLILGWAENKGLIAAKEVIENPPEQALLQWHAQGSIAAPTKDAMPKLLGEGG